MTPTIVLYIYLSSLCNNLLRLIYLIRDKKISAACIIGIQFQHLNYGDRLFYMHQSEFTLDQLISIKRYSHNCFICHSTDIEKVARNPFRPPDDLTNPLEPCNQCPIFDFSLWHILTRV